MNDRNVDPSGPPPDLGMSVERFYNPLVRRLAALPKPVICAVNGVAAGAGATLALGCDIVLAARSAKFVMAFSKLGLVPDCGSWFLPRVAGRARDGAGAAGRQPQRGTGRAVGIIWQLVDDSELADTSLQLARHLAAQPTFGLGLIKRRCWPLKPTVSTRSWTWSAIISVWPGAAMITAKGSARFWPNGHHSSAGNR